ncbi:MAG: rhodanese-like domain-containing protein [Reichenbachiella sp.]|uniref:rhodanese-like domain-containing protein n=1 Tax=Reichenbachiella sp. TaxID=2184521 RepID=UPI0032654BA5
MEEQINHYQQKLDFEWDAADLFENLEESAHVIVVDTRKTFAYDLEHIPGAVNIPHRTMDRARVAKLDKTAIYVCYCDGIGCNGSTKGALKMTQLGFKVRELIGGLDWWKRDGYSTEGAEAVTGTEIQCAC